MKTIVKYATAAAVSGALLLAAAAPGQARSWHHHRGGAILGGFAAGALIGAAAASAASDNYYYGPGPYAYGPAYVDDGYAYEAAPGPVYVEPAPQRCWHSTDRDRGYGYYGACY